MAASHKICVSRRWSGKYGWVGDDVGLHLGVTSAPVGGVQPVPLPLLSYLWPAITQVEKTRYGQILLSQRQDATAG